MVKKDEEIEVLDIEKFIEGIQNIFDEIEGKKDSSDEDDLSRVAELIIENFGNARSPEEMDDLSEIIINLTSPENSKKVRATIAEKLSFKYFNQSIIGYKTYKELLLTLKKDPDEDIRNLILDLSNGDIEKHLLKLKSDPEYIKAVSRHYEFITSKPFIINYKVMPEQIIAVQSALDNAKRVQEQFIAAQSALDNAKRVQEQITALMPTLDYYEHVAEKFATLNNLYLPSFNFIDIAKEFEELTPFWEEDEYKAFEYNWLGFCSADVILKLYEEYKKGNEEEVKKYFIKMFKNKNNIEKLKNKFQKEDIFLSRIHIIEDALDAHLDGKYTLSIPILLSQIDGIIIKKYGYLLKGKKKGNCPECGKQLSPMPNAKNIAFELLNEFDDIDSSYYLEFIKRDYNKNRIPILHGLKTNYSDPHYSTKLILALYRLFNLLNKEHEINN